MLYYLFEYLNEIDLPGAGVFQYISFRAGMAAFLSLLITITFGKGLINYLRKKLELPGHPPLIHTRRGSGFILTTEAA